MLIQIDPENAQLLDFEGTAGAVGRIEADKGGSKSFCLLFDPCLCGNHNSQRVLFMTTALSNAGFERLPV